MSKPSLTPTFDRNNARLNAATEGMDMDQYHQFQNMLIGALISIVKPKDFETVISQIERMTYHS